MEENTDGRDIHSVVFTFVDSDKADQKADEEGEVHVELLLALAKGVNSDMFAEYFDGNTEEPSVESYHLDNFGKGKYQTEIKLLSGTYHFLFKVTVVGESTIRLSHLHQRTVLASGRAVNYITCEDLGKEEEERPLSSEKKLPDLDEGTPLMKSDMDQEGAKENSGCCSCCTLL